MEAKYKNWKEDFKLPVSLGENYHGEDFRLRFTAGKSGVRYYDCSYSNGVYTNCVKIDDKRVLCIFDNHGLSTGKMTVETTICLPDTQMPDGRFKLNSKEDLVVHIDGKAYRLELNDGKSDVFVTTETLIDIIGTVIKGDPGKPLRYEDLTDEDKADLMKHFQDDVNKTLEEVKKKISVTARFENGVIYLTNNSK